MRKGYFCAFVLFLSAFSQIDKQEDRVIVLEEPKVLNMPSYADAETQTEQGSNFTEAVKVRLWNVLFLSVNVLGSAVVANNIESYLQGYLPENYVNGASMAYGFYATAQLGTDIKNLISGSSSSVRKECASALLSFCAQKFYDSSKSMMS